MSQYKVGPETEAYMQILLRQTDPLTFCPRPVWSFSSAKFGGPSHWSLRLSMAKSGIQIDKLAITVELAGAAYGKQRQALVFLVGAKLACWAFVGN